MKEWAAAVGQNPSGQQWIEADIATAARHASEQPSVGTWVFLLIVGVALCLWQSAVLTNFRGYRDAQGARARRVGERARKVAPYRWTGTTLPSRKAMTAMQIAGAIVFVLVGLALVVYSLVELIGELT